ncbi:MAG TPA: alpha/beta hydrolase [Bryobacteraceae bacterium]|nr:alpha/beta hydrolase [Bryobacteraceae bacterium]
MSLERLQFRILYRHFLFRMVDLEALTAHGDIQRLLGQLGAMLAALSFTLAVAFTPRYINSGLSAPRLRVAAWGDEEFLIATTIAVVGLVAVIAWNAMLPDRRDSLVLGALPVRMRTVFRAKVAAIGTALGVSMVAVNIFTGLSFAFLLAPPHAGALDALRSLSAYWISMFAAGIFIFSALLAVQGIAAQLLSYRRFLRVSSFLQLASFFVILGVYFLTPPLATVKGLTDPANQSTLAWLPSFWFLGLLQQLNGPLHPAFGPLAEQAVMNLGVCSLVAFITYALAYVHHMRRIVEQPDIAPADRSRASLRIGSLLARKLFPKPLDRAVLLFTARTIARSRQHRFLLAAYGGAGLAIALAYAKSLLYGTSRTPWYQLNRPLLVGSIVLLSFAVIAARAVFALPQALPANWVFRVTAVHSPAAYFAAVRKTLFTLTAVPIWIISAIAYFSIWPGRPALEHMLLLIPVGVLVVEISLYQFRKLPFACSYLPGGANINMRLGIYGILFLLAADVGTQFEFWSMQKPARFLVLLTVLLAAALWARRRTIDYAAMPENQIQFEEQPPGELFPLDLRPDGAWFSEQTYLDATDPHSGRPLRARLKPLAVGALVLMACGVAYEQAGRWRDRRLYPQIGHSVDIGGRSLNIYCSGQGTPAVILESGVGMPGLSWSPVQREIAAFTEACWYDRAGYGWSDPGPFPNHSDSVARDLQALLHASGLPPPYVLAGHSLGGLDVRVFNGMYPNEVAGLVLVDPTPEDLPDRIPQYAPPDWLQRPMFLAAGLAGELGVIRLWAPDPGPLPKGFTPAEWSAISSLRWQVKSQMANAKEGPLRTDMQQVKAAGGLEDLPLVVLSAQGNPDQLARIKLELHTEIAQLSAHGKLTVLPKSGHLIPFEAPEAVVGAVREVVTEIRAGAQPAAHFKIAVESRP